jgi:hypothetical protein
MFRSRRSISFSLIAEPDSQSGRNLAAVARVLTAAVSM